MAESLEDRLAPASGAWSAAIPEAARYALSEALGRDDASYAAAAAGNGYELSNAGNQYVATVDARGLRVAAGGDDVALTLRGIGYGGASAPLGAATSVSTANRVEYDYGGVSQWFVNGPLGVQQGFTLDARPAGSENGGPLTLELGVTGGLTAAADPGATSVSLVRADGSTALTYGGLIAYDAAGRSIPATLSVRSTADGDAIAIQVDDAGAQYPLVVDPFVQQQTFSTPFAGSNANFGYAVAVSADGGRLVATAPGALGFATGAAYVFDRSGSAWNQTAVLTPYTADNMGQSVAISADGSIVAVGASNYNYVDVFSWSILGWSQTARLNSPVGGQVQFGIDVELSDSGSTLLVGAYGTGSAYAYSNATGSWALTGELAGLPGANQGFAVALSGDGWTAAVAEPVYSNLTANVVYIYSFNGLGWTQSGLAAATGGRASDMFGTSISLSRDGGTLLVGAELAPASGYSAAGAAYVFTRSGSTWTQSAVITAVDAKANDSFGAIVSLSGDGDVAAIATSAYFFSTIGSVYVYSRFGTAWLLSSKVATTSGQTNDGYGLSLDVSPDGGYVVVGAPYADVGFVDQGSVYVYVNQQPPSITAQPTDVAVDAGTPATFTAAATGGPSPAVQWQVSTNGGFSWSNIFGATNSWYTLVPTAADSGKKFRAVFSNGIGLPATTNPATLTTTKAKAVVAITLGANPLQIGDPLSIAVAVTSASGLGAPNGGVIGVKIGPYTFAGLAAGGRAVFSIPTLASADYQVTAWYDGTYDPAFGNAYATAVQSVARRVTTLTAAFSTLNPAVGQPVTITAVLSYQGAIAAPGGGVVVKDNGGTPIAFIQLQPATPTTVAASFTTSSLAAGPHYMQLVYLGEFQAAPAASGVYTLTVGSAGFAAASAPIPAASEPPNSSAAAPPTSVPPPPTTSSVSGRAAPFGVISPTDQVVYADIPFTLTAAYPGSVGYSVQWQDSISGGAFWRDIPGATESWFTYTPGPYDFVKTYRAVFSNGAGAPVATNPAQVTLAKRPTVLTIVPSANPRRIGDPLTIEVDAAAASGPGGPDGGTIGLQLGPYSYNADLVAGKALFTIPVIDAGAYPVTARYDDANDESFGPAVATTTQLVVRAAASIATTPSTSLVVGGGPLTLWTTVVFGGGLGAMAGGVMFLDTGQPLAQVELTKLNGVYLASYTFPSLPVGDHYFQMVYLGTSNAESAASTVYKVSSIPSVGSSARTVTAAPPVTSTSTSTSDGRTEWLLGALDPPATTTSPSGRSTARPKPSGALDAAASAVALQSRYSAAYKAR